MNCLYCNQCSDKKYSIRLCRGADGNALFLILIAVALFAALSYAVTSSGRSSGGIEKEQAKIDQAVMDNYTAALEAGRLRLRITAGCSTIDYTPPDDQGGGDKSCHMFHPDGGDVVYRDMGLNACQEQENGDLTSLTIGESCGGLIYAGSVGGHRLYTTNTDHSAGTTWAAAYTVTGMISPTNGMENTNTIVGLSDTTYPAATLCRSLGAEWYLPATDELNLLYTNRNIGDLNGTFQAALYWSSSENNNPNGNAHVWRQDFSDGNQTTNTKDLSRRVRCVRSD